MGRRRHTPEQIITALREAEVGLANGKTVGMVSRELGISEQTYYRWRQERSWQISLSVMVRPSIYARITDLSSRPSSSGGGWPDSVSRRSTSSREVLRKTATLRTSTES